LFDEGIVQDLDDLEGLVNSFECIQDYRGYSLQLILTDFENFPLSDEILRMKNVRFVFGNQSKPIHKLVSPEPHFDEEERNLIENHFKYLVPPDNREDIEEWKCFQMDNEGQLNTIIDDDSNFHLSNESIEHLSNFPYFRNFYMNVRYEEENYVTNYSLLSNLRKLSMNFAHDFEDPELFQDPELLKDLGLFSNLIYLDLCSNSGF